MMAKVEVVRVARGVTASRQRVGQWVWCEGEPKPYHFYLFARRSVELADRPSTAQLHITASDRYVLFLNGRYVGRGPARSDPRRKSYDTYDVADRLDVGDNVIAVRAYHYGAPPEGEGWHARGGGMYAVGERAGLWVELDLTMADGASRVVGTDAAWSVRPASAWNRDVVPVGGSYGSPEVYDGNADAPDWMAVDFDDSAWAPARLIPARELDWFVLEPRSTALLREREVFPTRLVAAGEVIDQEPPGASYLTPTQRRRRARIDVARLLATEIQLPLEHARGDRPEALLSTDGDAAEFQGQIVDGHGIRQPYFVVDFGRQVFGFPRVRLEASQGATLDMTYDQLLVSGRVPGRLPVGDRYIARDGDQVWDVAAYRQFRYLHLTIRSPYAPVRIMSVSLNAYEYPAERRGAFACSDPLLTELWSACADTVYLNMEDTLVADAWRERAQYSGGDPRHGLLGMYVAYGDLPLADRLLQTFPPTDRGGGKLQIVFPPASSDPRYFIPQHLLAWSVNAREHYLFTGRRDVLEDLYLSVRRQIDWYEPHRDGLGLLRDLPGWNWLDWAPVDLRGANLATNILYVAGLEAAAWLATQLGHAADAERWTEIAQAVRSQVQRVFWNDDRGLFEDSHHNGSLTGIASEHGNALAVLHDIATDEQVARIVEHVVASDARLAQATPAYFGDVIAALLCGGLLERGLEAVSGRYRPMLELMDNPTVWESWGPFLPQHDPITSDEQVATRKRMRQANPRSLTHVSAVGAGVALTTHLLGVTPTGPGFATCTIHPRPGVLEWAEGTVPTPHGDLKVKWTRNGAGLTLSVQLPGGVEADVVLDREVGVGQLVHVDGETFDPDDANAAASVGCRVERRTVRVRIAGGAHRIELHDSRDAG